MAKNLPGLNYDGKLSIDDLTFQSDETEKAILDRTTIVFGNRSLAEPRYGIIDVISPQNVVVEETTRPLLVYASTINPLNINITAGSVVTSNGSIVINSALIEDFTLVRTAINDINVVFIENEIIDAPPVRKTRYNVDQNVRRIQNSSVIRVSLLSDYLNDILFPPTRRSNIVVLAVVTVVQNASSLGYELQFDYTSSVYSFNRPWYSPVDIEHRSKLGGGTATDQNTHGLTFNDLVSGNLTLYDQLLPVGSIQARDDLLKGVPGTPCYELIEASRILTDGTGITSESRYGGSGARYVELADFPTQITAFYLTSNKGRDIAWDHIPGTKIIVLPIPETFAEQATIWYNKVFAALPPTQIFSNNLAFGQPDETKELILTGGVALSTLTNQFIDFDGSGPVPRNYTLYIKSDGTLLKSPQPIQTPYLLDDIGTIPVSIAASIFGPAKISIGLAGATPVSSMQIVIRLTGRDVDDNALTEDITFSGTTWQSTPPLENSNQYILSTNVYRVLSTFAVISRANDGPNAKIQLWAELETQTTVDLSKLARIASVMWDSTGIADLKDLRDISITKPAPQHRYIAAASIAGMGGSNPRLAFSEDFALPVLRNSTTGSQTDTFSTVRIIIADYSRIHVTPPSDQDYITFPNGVVVYAVASLPNRSAGEFARFSSNQDTRDDLITTLNDLSFASGYTAVADTALGDGTLLVTANIPGARGNGLVVKTDFDSTHNAFAISPTAGLVGGIDAFGECFLPKHVNYIDTSIPSPSTYDVSSYRYRYESVPLPINLMHTINAIVHGVPVPQTDVQLRMRFARDTEADWQPWEVLTGNGVFFTVTKSYPISKIQIQLFGKVSGFSVYEV